MPPEQTRPTRRVFVQGATGALVAAASTTGRAGAAGKALRLAVVTGSHPFDVPALHQLFRSMNGVDPYVQHIEEFAWSPEAVRDAYDAVVFYFMPMQGPADPVKPVLEHLGATAQGIIVLHHGLLAYPEWPVWSDIVGITNRSFGFHPEQSLRVQVANRGAIITKGLQDWAMADETYTMSNAGSDSTVLLTTDHPKSMKTLAWSREYRRSRVFCFASGHDNQTWSNPGFRTAVTRGIRWAARRL